MGVQKTSVDSAGLRNDITGSLAQVLSQNSTVFIKSYGRATLSTTSFGERLLLIPNLERNEAQFTHAGYGGLFHHPILFHR